LRLKRAGSTPSRTSPTVTPPPSPQAERLRARSPLAPYGVGGWISLTTGKFAKRNRVEKPKTNPKP